MTEFNFLFIVVLYLIFFRFQAYAMPYDSSFTLECLEEPLEAQYEGGIVVNSELNEGSNGWTSFGDTNIEHQISDLGNKFLVASKRNRSFHSFSQTFQLEENKYYIFSAWLRVSDQKADVAAIFATKTNNFTLGWTTAQKGCWSMLKGGLVPNNSGPAHLYFKAQNTKVDLWGDSFSLQQFTHQEWTSHQDYSIEKVRKTSVELRVLDEAGRPVPNASISVTQKLGHFPFGCAINSEILTNTKYQKWFLSRFNKSYTVFENELKWPYTEPFRWIEDYSVPDKMVRFAETNNISIRGHCVLWDIKKAQPMWALSLPRNDLLTAVKRRLNSVLNQYKGKFFHWDVENENIHNDFFESTLNDKNVSGKFYRRAHELDPKATMFMNEYNVIEEPSDTNISPRKYVDKVLEIKKQGNVTTMGIGVQGHFRVSNPTYIRTSLDILGKSGSPVWITELDVAPGVKQADYLKQILPELYSHSAVKGIIIWAAWKKEGCYQMCLTDNNFANLATGNVVDAFMRKLAHAEDLELRGRTTDSNGVFEASLRHGVYQVRVDHPNGLRSGSSLREIDVRPNGKASSVFRVTVNDK